MRCILVEALLTTLKSPQSSGTKFPRNFHKHINCKKKNLVQVTNSKMPQNWRKAYMSETKKPRNITK
jgi:hypothetical protein